MWSTPMLLTAFGEIGEISSPEREDKPGQDKGDGRP